MKVLNTNKWLLKLFLATVLFFCFNLSFAQPGLPQRTLTVAATQPIHFGTFCVTGKGGGTITVGWDGSRTSTGGIILISTPNSQPAIFEIEPGINGACIKNMIVTAYIITGIEFFIECNVYILMAN